RALPGLSGRSAAGRTRLLTDAQRRKLAEDDERLALVLGGDAERVERSGEIFGQDVAVRVRDPPAGVGGRRVSSRGAAGAARGLADLLHEERLEPRDVGVRESPVDPRVPQDVAHERVDDENDGGLAAEPVVEG